jgi:phosphatidate cytidylyltransferase
VPQIFAAEDEEEEDDAAAWSSFTSGQPRWRGEGPQVEEDYDDFSRLADDETRVGALAADETSDPRDFFAFDEPTDDRWHEPEPVPVGAWDDDEESWEEYGNPGRTRSISSDPRRSGHGRAGGYQRPPTAGRNVPVAIGVGLAFAAVALLCFWGGPVPTAAMVTVVLGIAAAELFNVLRQAGYQPATLLGLSATVALPLAAYNKGEVAIPLVLFLAVTFGLVWYLAGAGGEDRPVIGLSSTLLGVGWIGLLGAFAALMVADGGVGGFGDDGIGVLLVAVLGAVAYDVGGFAVGRNAGSRALSAASPNKTVEGLVGGVAVSLVTTVVAASMIFPFEEVDFGGKVVLGVAVALAATLGDLCESLVKRDLDVKDMGSILPEHGGFLDRFDSLLFVLPTAYYLARVLLG